MLPVVRLARVGVFNGEVRVFYDASQFLWLFVVVVDVLRVQQVRDDDF
jgi:hypothetical protein